MSNRKLIDNAVMDLANNGVNGFEYISGTTAKTGNWTQIQVVTAATFTKLTNTPGITGTITAVSLPVGTILKGIFTEITLSAGTVIVYNQ